jgi:hypothetical protein
MTPDTSQKFEIDWLRTAGGAFAAVSSAFLLSTLGAAGTIIGAALGSVIVTVGGALYSQGLAHSHRRLAQVQTAAKRKVGVAQAEVRRANRQQGDGQAADVPLAHAEERLDEVKDDLDHMVNEPAGPGWRERFVELPWKRISLIAAGLFAAAILVITAIEAVAGESVSSITGGTEDGGRTTLGNIGGGSPTEDNEAPSDDGSSEQPEPTNTPTGEPTPAPETPSPTPSPPEPTPAEPTPTAPVEPTAPAETPPTG